MLTASHARVFRFADVEVRERQHRVTRAGRPVAIEPKAVRVLLYLLENAGHVVTKEELLGAVWGDTAVTDNSLTRAVALIRRVLDDDPHMPGFIETVSTAGYRFICPVEIKEESRGEAVTEGGGAAAEPTVAIVGATAPEAASVSRGMRVRWVILTGSVLLLLLAAGALWYLGRPLPPPRITAYTQITHDGRHKFPVAADGARLYLALYNQPEQWAQVPTSGGNVTPLSVPLPNPVITDVSQDGASLLVISSDNDRQSVWTVQSQGGALRRLWEGSGIVSAKWSPDGKLVAFDTLSGDLYVIRNDGAEPLKLASVPFHIWDVTEISWSPDGSRIRFTRDFKLWEVFSSGSGLHPMFPHWRPSEQQMSGRWTQDGRYFVFVSRTPLIINPWATPPSGQIWALDERRSFLRRSTAEPVQLTAGPMHWGSPIPSRDGKVIFSRGVTLRGELVRFEAKTRELQPYLSGISAEWTDFSPDGKSVLYVTFPEGILWKANRDGSNPAQLTEPPLYPIAPHWSPDGRQIVFHSPIAEARPKIFMVPSQGGKPQLLLPAENRTPEKNPNWSPDGRKIVFDTETADGFQTLRILDVSSHQVTDIPGAQGRWSPRWSPDGRYIAALVGPNGAMAVFDFNTQRWSPVIEKGEVGIHIFSHDGKFIYFLRPIDRVGVYRIRPTGGEVEKVADLKDFRFTGYAAYFMGLDPQDAPLLLRDTGVDDIFALTLEEP